MSRFSNSSDLPFWEKQQQPFDEEKLLQESEKIFPLINTVISWEDCIQYQILPLFLENQKLIVGIVDQNNTSSIEKIQHVGTSYNYSLNLQQIDLETYQTVLWLYSHHHESDAATKERIRIDERPTFIVKTPEELKQEEDKKNVTSPPPSKPDSTPQRSSVPLYTLPTLNLSAEYQFQAPEFLLTLTPKQLFFELLAQIVTEGIGRLYFQQNQDHGCIFLTQNGVSKLVLENVNLNLFQGLIYELKYFVRHPLKPVQKVKTIEMNRRYRQEHIVLRLQMIPHQFGEEATLQVLRGEALRFHQQQKMHKLSQDALKLTQYLERKIKQLETCSRFSSTPLDIIPLQKQLQKINQRLNNL